ncbi:hypothetical protein H072_9067 [Dactylellina haptotyla CBS 200.50]|uniref:BTB domain-containing protein n=1 Tax=Dactylellina haptotyla (strain CBS 200.50) TaxID=1284197 RepID=S8BDI5_DACHA|nr:hypothetical protein H072_9067 [Dactylellina haptotyla CBS 200.50]
MSDTTITDIDPAGDVLIICYKPTDDGDKVLGTLRISSKVLSLASPVFGAMLEPSKNLNDSQTNLESDVKRLKIQCESLDILVNVMNITHIQNQRIPATVTLIFLYDLATWCDTYQVAEALTPVINRWIEILWVPRPPIGHDQFAVDMEWMWIAKVFHK